MNHFHRWPRDVYEISGADTDTYLQGQLSQDIVALAPGQAAWSFVLEPQGKVAAWFRITRRADNRFVVDVDAGHGAALVERLQRFKLRVDVDIEPLDWQVVAIRGSDPVDHDLLERAALGVAVDWSGFEGVDLLGADIGDVALPELTAAEFAARRIAAGFPAMGSELTADTIPNESGIVEQSVSFTKGCYTGQELVARVDSRGNNTPKRLQRVLADAAGIEPGAVLTVGDTEAGTVTSAAFDEGRTVALAYIKRAVETPTEALVQTGQGPVTVQIEPLA